LVRIIVFSGRGKKGAPEFHPKITNIYKTLNIKNLRFSDFSEEFTGKRYRSL